MGVVAVRWIVTSGLAFRAIRRGQVAAHRAWMMRSVALALGAATLRIYLPLLSLADVPFLYACRIAAWGSWLPNLATAELLLWRERRSASWAPR